MSAAVLVVACLAVYLLPRTLQFSFPAPLNAKCLPANDPKAERDASHISDFAIVVVGSDIPAASVWRNLMSLVHQDYPYWRLIYVNDVGSAEFGKALQNGVDELCIGDRATVLKEKRTKGIAASYIRALKHVNDNEVVVLLNGADWLGRPDALTELNKVYHEQGCFRGQGPRCLWVPGICESL